MKKEGTVEKEANHKRSKWGKGSTVLPICTGVGTKIEDGKTITVALNRDKDVSMDTP